MKRNQRYEDSRTSKDPFYYRYREVIVGIFVTIPVIVISILLTYAFTRMDIFADWTHFYLKCAGTYGLKEGSPVNILGKKVGHIQSLSLNNGGYVEVCLKVKEEFRHFIHRDSRAVFRQKSLLVSDMDIDITLGSETTGVVNDNDTLAVYLPGGIDSLLIQVQAIVKPVEKIVSRLSEDGGIIKYLLGSDTIVTNTNGLVQDIRVLSSNLDSAIDRSEVLISTYTELGTEGVRAIDSLVTIITTAEQTMQTVQAAVVTTDSVIARYGSIPDTLDGILKVLRRDLEESERVIRSLRYHRLFRRAMERQSAAESPKK